MNTKTTIIYSDASYCKARNIAILGFARLVEMDHTSWTVTSEQNICFEEIFEKNNVRSEIRSAIAALKSCSKNTEVKLYSDCHAVTDLIRRRKKLEAQKYISQRSGITLNNADLYQEFYTLSDQLKIETHWMSGHSPNSHTDIVTANFSFLDKQVRKKLRSKILELEDTKNEKNILFNY